MKLGDLKVEDGGKAFVIFDSVITSCGMVRWMGQEIGGPHRKFYYEEHDGYEDLLDA